MKDIKLRLRLNQLSHEENALLAEIDRVEGTMEDKSRQLKDKGIYDAYCHIHTQYAALASSNLEALKRGFFLQWFSLVDPTCFTGLWELDSKAERKIIEALNDRLCTDKVDSELRCMVSYYAGWEWIFSLYNGYECLNSLLANRIDFDIILTELSTSNLVDRGQMGKYWQSII
ncbi:hypothetical protein JYG30_19695 [Fibrella sp. USSR17]